jgi:hypothetical protein
MKINLCMGTNEKAVFKLLENQQSRNRKKSSQEITFVPEKLYQQRTKERKEKKEEKAKTSGKEEKREVNENEFEHGNERGGCFKLNRKAEK